MHISCSLRSQAVQGKNHTFLPSNPQQHLLWHRSFVMHDSTSIAVAYLTSPTWCQWSSKGHSSSALLICLKPTKSKLKQVTFQTLYSQWRKIGTNTDHTSSRTSKMGHIIHMFKWLSLKGLLCVPRNTPLDNSWACFRGKMTWKAVPGQDFSRYGSALHSSLPSPCCIPTASISCHESISLTGCSTVCISIIVTRVPIGV